MKRQIEINKMLQILGAKEIEITMLREHIQKLEQEKKTPESLKTTSIKYENKTNI